MHMIARTMLVEQDVYTYEVFCQYALFALGNITK